VIDRCSSDTLHDRSQALHRGFASTVGNEQDVIGFQLKILIFFFAVEDLLETLGLVAPLSAEPRGPIG